MRAYLSVTGTIFGLVVVAHIWRMIAENHAFARDPAYVALTVLCAAFSVWAWRLYRRLPPTNSHPASRA